MGKSAQKEKVLYTQKGVHHLNLVPCGCGDKGKVAAVPMSSSTWFPRQRQDGGCSLQLALPSLGLRQWQTMTDKFQKSWIVCTGLPFFFSRLLCSADSIPCSTNTSDCSTLLHLARLISFWLSSAGIGLTSAAPLPIDTSHAPTAFHHCVLELRLGGTGRGWGTQNMCFTGLILAMPPNEERETKWCASKGTFLFLPPKTMLPQWWCMWYRTATWLCPHRS